MTPAAERIVTVTARPTGIRKRAIDVVVSAATLIFLALVFPFLAVLIKLDSRGPIFFVQPRVGRGGRIFKMYKFRTMTADAEAQLEYLQELNKGGQQLIRIADDPRVTRMGRFLRPLGIDELPQLINVLKGDMSIVGPRPQSPSEVLLYTPHQCRRLEVLPGITGLWQVMARENPSFDLWVQWDLEYIDHWSLLRDAQIVIKTPLVILAPLVKSAVTKPIESIDSVGATSSPAQSTVDDSSN